MPNTRAIALILCVLISGCAILRDTDVDVGDTGVSSEADGSPMSDPDVGTSAMDDSGPDTDASTLPEIPADWWDEAYKSRVRIRGDWDREISLAEVPLPLHWARHVAAAVNFRELRVVDEGGNVIPHSVSNADGEPVVWVRVDELKARSELTAYWDNPDALDVSSVQDVWGPEHRFVAHFDGDAVNVLAPATPASVIGEPREGEGIVGLAWDMGSEPSRLTFERDDGYGTAPGDVYTYEVWARLVDGPPGRGTLVDHEGLCDGMRLYVEPDLTAWFNFSAGNQCDDYERSRVTSAALTAGEWHYFAMVVDREAQVLEAWVDGQSIGEDPIARTTGGVGHDLHFGGDVVQGSPFTGTLDEPRIAAMARDQQWFEIQFAAGKDAFFVWQAVEQID